MKLYFTGAAVYEDPQSSSLLSLGGYPSSSPVPRIGLNKLFGPISQKDLREGAISTKAVVLKNETGAQVAGATIHYENDSQFPVTSFRMALVTLAVDSCGKLSMEKIVTPQDSPISALFIDNLNVGNALTIPTMEIDDYIGIWIERTVNKATGTQLLDCDYLLEAFDDAEGDKVAHVVDVTVNNVALEDEHFTFDTIDEKYVVWLQDALPAPAITSTCQTLIVPLNTGSETLDTIAAKIESKLSSIVVPKGTITVAVANNVVTITNIIPGKVSTPIESSVNVTSAVTTQGVSNQVEITEAVNTLINY